MKKKEEKSFNQNFLSLRLIKTELQTNLYSNNQSLWTEY